mgnify:CR=1 FL=1
MQCDLLLCQFYCCPFLSFKRSQRFRPKVSTSKKKFNVNIMLFLSRTNNSFNNVHNLRPPQTSVITSLLVFIIFISVQYLSLPSSAVAASDTPSSSSSSSNQPYENSHDLLNLHLLEDVQDKSSSAREDCRNPTLSSFLRSFKLAPFLPDDYRRVTKSMDLGNEDRPGNIYNRVNSFNDTLKLVDRLLAYGEKVAENEDFQDAVKYLTTTVIDMMYAVRVTPECQVDLMRIAEAAREKQLWAWRCK